MKNIRHFKDNNSEAYYYLKRFETFQDREQLKEYLSDLFIQFEDEGWKVNTGYNEIVPDRNDWTGNLDCAKVRKVWGGEFIDYHDGVIMSKGEKKWIRKSALIVTISKINHIEGDGESDIIEHWKSIDSEIVDRITSIKSRSEKLNLDLYGAHGKWYSLGKASHSDFEGLPYYNWNKLIDSISFAFYY